MLRFSLVVAIMTITVLANVVTSDRFGLWTPGDRADQNRCDPLLPTAALFNLKLIHQAAARRGECFRPARHSRHTSLLLALLLQMSGLELNPGPAIRMGALNAQSIVRKGALINDLIGTHNLDVLALCETWIVDDDPEVIKQDAVPAGYAIRHVVRPTATPRNRGGGLCIPHRQTVVIKTTQTSMNAVLQDV